jgi:hypothetical protein
MRASWISFLEKFSGEMWQKFISFGIIIGFTQAYYQANTMLDLTCFRLLMRIIPSFMSMFLMMMVGNEEACTVHVCLDNFCKVIRVGEIYREICS